MHFVAHLSLHCHIFSCSDENYTSKNISFIHIFYISIKLLLKYKDEKIQSYYSAKRNYKYVGLCIYAHCLDTSHKGVSYLSHKEDIIIISRIF